MDPSRDSKPDPLFLRTGNLVGECRLLEEVGRDLTAVTAKALESLGLNVNDGRIVLLLVEKGTLPFSRLGDLLHMRKQSLSRGAERLAAAKLVHKMRTEEDQRLITLMLTPRGRALGQRLSKLRTQYLATAYRSVGDPVAIAGFSRLVHILCAQSNYAQSNGLPRADQDQGTDTEESPKRPQTRRRAHPARSARLARSDSRHPKS